ELGGELLAPEREELDHDDFGTNPAEGLQDARGPLVQTGQRDDLEPARKLEILGKLAAGEQHDVETLREGLRERQRANEVPQSERVMAVEEQPRLHPSSSRATASTSCNLSSPSSRSRVIDRSARSRRRAAAVYQRTATRSCDP